MDQLYADLESNFPFLSWGFSSFSIDSTDLLGLFNHNCSKVREDPVATIIRSTVSTWTSTFCTAPLAAFKAQSEVSSVPEALNVQELPTFYLTHFVEEVSNSFREKDKTDALYTHKNDSKNQESRLPRGRFGRFLKIWKKYWQEIQGSLFF